MKLLTIDSREMTGRPGALLNTGEILDLVAAPNTLSEAQWVPHSIVSVLAAGQDGLDRVDRLIRAAEDAVGPDRERLQTEGVLLPFAGTALMAPIRRPGLVLVADLEFGSYIKSPNTVVGNGASVKVPWAGRDTVVGTGMLAVVIGRSMYRADLATAEEAIMGYTLLVDLSMKAPGVATTVPEWRRYMESKQFPGACPIGPVIITKDEIDGPGRLVATATINGIDVAEGELYGGRLDVAGLLAELSERYAFRPGDLIAIEPPTDAAPGWPQELGIGDKFALRLGDLTELDVKIT